MEDMTSSKLALRSLLKESKDKRASGSLIQERALVNPQVVNSPALTESDDKRKEQLRIGKVIFDFFENRSTKVIEDEAPVRKRGRPSKETDKKAKNITICLSKDHIDLLDKLDLKNKKAKGRGRKVRFLIDSYVKYQNREKEQVRAIQESLRVIASHIDIFSRNFKRAEKFTENERSITDMEKAISNLRIVQSLLKIESNDLRKYLSEKELSTFEFALSWISNKAGDQ